MNIFQLSSAPEPQGVVMAGLVSVVCAYEAQATCPPAVLPPDLPKALQRPLYGPIFCREGRTSPDLGNFPHLEASYHHLLPSWLFQETEKTT